MFALALRSRHSRLLGCPCLHWSAPVGAGEVDATAHGVLKTRFGITGYPTIKFLRDGTVQDYTFPRTVEGFTSFAERMNGAHSQRGHAQAGSSAPDRMPLCTSLCTGRRTVVSRAQALLCTGWRR